MWPDDDFMSADKEDREETGRTLQDDPRQFNRFGVRMFDDVEALAVAIANGEDCYSAGDAE